MAERLVVVWRVTTRCNLSCGFCAYDRRLPFARGDADEKLAGALGRAWSQTRAGATQPVHVSFLGGEPFLWEPLPRVARRFSEQGLSLGITTNGLSLGSAAARELLLDCFDELTLSIDGVGVVHDQLRGCPAGFERLQLAVDRLLAEKARRGRGPLLRVNTVLMRDNWRDFPRLCHALADWGVQELTFNRLGGRDRPEFYAAHRLLPAELECFASSLPELRLELAARGLRILGAPGYVERLVSLERGMPVAVANCEPGHDFSFVDEDGRIAPCSFTLDSYGEPATTADAAHAWGDLPARFLMRQRTERAQACDDCASTRVFDKFRGA